MPKSNKDHNVKEAMSLIAEACELLGWSVCMPEDDDVTFLVMGIDKEVERIAELLEMDANPGQWN